MSNFGQSGPTASGGRPVSQVQPTSQPTQSQPNKRLQDTQSQVNEVVDIMKANVDKVLERDQNLSELNYRADSLHDGARQFENTATRLKRKYWWQNCKMWLILIAVLVVIIIIIIVAIVTSVDSVPKSGGSSDPLTTTKAPGGR